MPSKLHKSKISPEPAVAVIFGFTGDLSRRKLIPALYHLQKHGLLDNVQSIFGVARPKMSVKEAHDFVYASVFECCGVDLDLKVFADFYKKIRYIAANFKKAEDMRKFARVVERREHRLGVCAKRLFYLAVPPSLHESLAASLSSCGFLEGCREGERKLRVVVEKPFGRDLTLAKRLNEKLLQYFSEEEIYRIDHYLGKEAVQNLLVTRFANAFFEPVWNYKYIDQVEITVAEDIGIEHRGKFYEETGALRDVMQNHMLQVLSLVAMEPPAKLDAKQIHDAKHRVLKSLRRMNKKTVSENVVRAQYTGSLVKGKRLLGYTQEPDVKKNSQTETYVALKVYIDNKRWREVPFYLTTGKRLPKKSSKISVHFKKPLPALFKGVRGNVLNFRLQPDEGVDMEFMMKKPGLPAQAGFALKLARVKMEMGYHESFEGELPSAYERLLLDWIHGDKTLFVRTDNLYEAWDFTTKILNIWKKEKGPIPTYKAGTWGPSLK